MEGVQKMFGFLPHEIKESRLKATEEKKKMKREALLKKQRGMTTDTDETAAEAKADEIDAFIQQLAQSGTSVVEEAQQVYASMEEGDSI